MMNHLFKNKFLTSISILAIGSIVAQVVSFFLVPFITRQYSPEEFAVFTYILSIAAIFMGIVNCRFDMTIVKTSLEYNAFALIKGSLLIGMVFAFLILVISLPIFAIKDGFSWYHSFYLYIFLVSYALINVLTAYNNRLKEYKIISIVNFIRPISQNIGALILSYCPIGANGLLLSYVVGQFLGISKQNQSLKGKWNIIRKIPNNIVLRELKANKNQFYFSTPAQLLNSFSYSSITIVIEALFGLAFLGYYSLSVRLLGLPLTVISGNVSKVFYENAVQEYAINGTYWKSLRKALLFLLMLAIPMVIIIMLFIPDLCGIFFGKEWIKAGEYIRILSPMFGIRFIVATLTPALIIVNKQKKEFLLQSLFIISVFLSFLLTKVLSQEVFFFLMCISISFSLIYIYYLMVIIKYSHYKIS